MTVQMASAGLPLLCSLRRLTDRDNHRSFCLSHNESATRVLRCFEAETADTPTFASYTSHHMLLSFIVLNRK